MFSPGNLLEMRVHRPHPRSTELYTLGRGPPPLFSTGSPVDCNVQKSLRSKSERRESGRAEDPRRRTRRGERKGARREEKGQNRKESKKKGPKRGTLRKENHSYPKIVVSSEVSTN